jgi:hypothetical protein
MSDNNVGALRDKLNDPSRHGMAQSTIDAFKFVLRQNDPERLRAWLERRRPDERAALKKLMHDASGKN